MMKIGGKLFSNSFQRGTHTASVKIDGFSNKMATSAKKHAQCQL